MGVFALFIFFDTNPAEMDIAARAMHVVAASVLHEMSVMVRMRMSDQRINESKEQQ